MARMSQLSNWEFKTISTNVLRALKNKVDMQEQRDGQMDNVSGEREILTKGNAREIEHRVQMSATYVILSFMVIVLKKQKETGEINFNNILYLIPYSQNSIIQTCNQYQKLMKHFTFFFCTVFEI